MMNVLRAMGGAFTLSLMFLGGIYMFPFVVCAVGVYCLMKHFDEG